MSDLTTEFGQHLPLQLYQSSLVGACKNSFPPSSKTPPNPTQTCKQLMRAAHERCTGTFTKAFEHCARVMNVLQGVYEHSISVLDNINPDRWQQAKNSSTHPYNQHSNSSLSHHSSNPYNNPSNHHHSPTSHHSPTTHFNHFNNFQPTRK